MFFYIFMCIIGFVLLVAGADLLIRGASNIASKFHIPEMIIGLTIVALGTSAPELIITINSALSGSTDLIIGNAIGSNLCNLLLILGLMAILRPVLIDRDAKHIHIPISLVAALVILFIELTEFSSHSLYIDRIDGIILVILFLIYFTYPIVIEVKKIMKSYSGKKEAATSDNEDAQSIEELVENNIDYKLEVSNTENESDNISTSSQEEQNKESLVNKFKNLIVSTFKGNKPISIWFSIVFIIIGVVLLKYGGDFVVDYATNIAQQFDISERVIGLTIVAIGTAMPELVTSIIATFRKDTDLAVGNLVGSCVLNLFLILGIGAIITPLAFSVDFTQNLILLCVSTFILWLFNFIGKKNTITRFKGLILLLIFAGYMWSLFVWSSMLVDALLCKFHLTFFI